MYFLVAFLLGMIVLRKYSFLSRGGGRCLIVEYPNKKHLSDLANKTISSLKSEERMGINSVIVYFHLAFFQVSYKNI
jgi:hypothetical protein